MAFTVQSQGASEQLCQKNLLSYSKAVAANSYYQRSAPERFECWQELAGREFPDEEASIALQKYAHSGLRQRIEGIFFVDDNGDRCVWGQDIEYRDLKQWQGRGWKQRNVGDRVFILNPPEINLKKVDVPKRTSHLARHPSEGAWNLPKSKAGHAFMIFRVNMLIDVLAEIKDLILHFALTMRHADLSPVTTACNWKRLWSPPRYLSKTSLVETCGSAVAYHGGTHDDRSDDTEQAHSLTFAKRRDRFGTYTEMRQVNRREIDAAILRTCKAFHAAGTRMLYGDNSYAFPMNESTFHGSPPTLIGKSRQFFHPIPNKPACDDAWLAKVDVGISNIFRNVPLTELEGWIYHDPFLRFLHSIGPKKASMLKTLKFYGQVKIHCCAEFEGRGRHDCTDDFVASIRLYVPFIIALCPGLEKLWLFANQDEHYAKNPHALFPPAPSTIEEAFTPLLENEIRQIPTLQDLRIIVNGKCNGHEFAAPTIAWVKEQAAERERECRNKLVKAGELQNTAEQVQAADLQCVFCEEDHVWAECHNLCSFCGSHRHDRSRCTELLSGAEYSRKTLM